MKVQNISYEVDTLDIKHPLYKIVKQEVDSGKLTLWKKNKNIVRFDLINSNEAFANALRRTFNDELLIKSMFIHPSDLDTNDKFILPDNIIERVNLVSFDQTYEDWQNLSLSIKVSNETGDIITVYSKDILINSKRGGLSSEKLFNQNIILCTLRPGKYLYLNNIVIKKKEGFINNVYTLGTHRYECINTDFSIPSLENNLTDFRIEFRDNSNSSHKNMIELVKNNLYSRVTRVKNLISSYVLPEGAESAAHKQMINDNKGNEVYIIRNTNIVDLHSINNFESSLEEKDMAVWEIHINNEYHTLGNIITKYVYLEDPSIELINYKLAHILKHKIIVTIKHSDYKKIIDNALNSFLKDLETWESSFN